MTTMSQPFAPASESGFLIAAFSAFGHFEGVKWQEYDGISSKWIGLCRELFLEYGGIFDYRWSGNLSHIRTRFTSTQGAGVCTIFVYDHTAYSMLLVGGQSGDIEKDVMNIFLQSIRTPLLNTSVGRVEAGFSELDTISDRPLMAVVPFPNDEISVQNHEIVRELGWHMAAAFLQDRR